MPKAKYDLNDNGKIDPDERDIMLEDRRRMMEDADAKRDAQLRMTWFALSGMVLYPCYCACVVDVIEQDLTCLQT